MLIFMLRKLFKVKFSTARQADFMLKCSTFCLVFAQISCANKTPQPTEQVEYRIAEHKNHLTVEMSHRLFLDLQKQFKSDMAKMNIPESDKRFAQKNRGEAHITLLTPPEWEQLKEKMTIHETEKIAQEIINPIDFKVLCLGQGKKENMYTYFYVVQFEKAFEFRKKIAELYKKRTAKKEDKKAKDAFSAERYYPHITVGFTEKDLHEQDGVIKNQQSCLTDLNSK